MEKLKIKNLVVGMILSNERNLTLEWYKGRQIEVLDINIDVFQNDCDTFTFKCVDNDRRYSCISQNFLNDFDRMVVAPSMPNLLCDLQAKRKTLASELELIDNEIDVITKAITVVDKYGK